MYLGDVNGNQGLWECPELAGLDDAGDGPPIHVLQDDVQVGASLEGADVLHYVLVVQVAQQLYLPHDALQGLRRYASQGQLLDGYRTPRPGVNPLEHLPT